MKRLASLMLLITTLSTLPAQALTWFDDGEKLHRDPFCMDAAFSFNSFYSPSLECATPDEALARSHSILCESCTALAAPVEDADAPVVWYYNPDGGKYYHRNQNCPSIRSAYLPLTGLVTAERPDWLPDNACSVCGYANQVLRSPSDTRGWNATPEEKAALLPGVWTIPTEEALSCEKVLDIVNEHLKTLLPEKQYCCSIAHYDQGSPDESRATYKVIVTTLLRHPVCIVYVDALTGEVCHHQLAEEFEK